MMNKAQDVKTLTSALLVPDICHIKILNSTFLHVYMCAINRKKPIDRLANIGQTPIFPLANNLSIYE